MPDIYEYKTINVSLEPPPEGNVFTNATIETAANRWGEMGWRTVGVMPGDRQNGFADAILIERKVNREFIGIQYKDSKGQMYIFAPEDVTFIYTYRGDS